MRARRPARRTVFVAMHSFTPVFKGESRAMQVGVLYNRDARLAAIMLELLRAEGDLTVGDNAPYAVSDVTDYGVPVHAERRGLPHVEIEIRQDLIADEAGQAAWAARFARCCRAVAVVSVCAMPEPRGADRSRPRRAAVRRCAELQRAAGWRRVRRA